MRRIRIIPTLLLDANGGLVKTIRFGKRTYIGDPINAVKIFNDKGADELLLLDIDAAPNGYPSKEDFVREIVSEAFMPVGYGGGVHSLEQATSLFRCGVEKIVICSNAVQRPELISEIAGQFGSQSTVVCMNVKRKFFGGYQLKVHGSRVATGRSPVDFAKLAVDSGAGEIIVNSIDRDGTFGGYDHGLLKAVADGVDVPVVACGGARTPDDFRRAVAESGCAAAAAGSMFVFHSRTKGVLISYPSSSTLENEVFLKI